jgi:hypothetical protein
VTGSRSADVTVQVRRSGASTEVEFSTRRPGVPAFRAPLARAGALSQVRRALDEGLVGLKDLVPDLSVPEEQYEEVYLALNQVGRRLLFLLFGLNQSVLHGLQSFWNTALPFGRNPALPPLIESVGDEEAFLPLECLPLFSIGPVQGPIRSNAAFVHACRTMVGFSCMVRRTMLPIPQRGGLDLDTDDHGRLPMRFLHHDELDGAKAELTWLQGHKQKIDLEGPFPDSGSLGLPEQIFDPRHRLDGSIRELPDQIQHFACHCYTTRDRPLSNEIELSGAGTEIRLELGTLAEELVALAVGRTRPPFDLPLVMMNACGSARMHATSATSFPSLFLQHGNRGFIGTEIEVPDDVAAVFSTSLYESLFLHRRSLGEAMLHARAHLLLDHGNPLGIVYAAYADPDLRIRHRLQERPDVTPHV